MLAYTAVDGLRAISRDFDLHWQPDVSVPPATSGRDWRGFLRTGHQALGAIVLLLSCGAAARLH